MWVLDSTRLENERRRQEMSVQQLAAAVGVELWQLRIILDSDGQGLDPSIVVNLASALGVQPIDISRER